MKVVYSWIQNGLPTREGPKPVDTVLIVQAFMSLLENGKLGQSDFDWMDIIKVQC